MHLLGLHLRSGVSTVAWPEERLAREGPPRGTPLVEEGSCTGCGDCGEACPSRAMTIPEGGRVPVLDAGMCVGCGRCVGACPEGAVVLGGREDLAAHGRGDLVLDGRPPLARHVGPPPSRLYRRAVARDGRTLTSPEALLRRRERDLGLDR